MAHAIANQQPTGRSNFMQDEDQLETMESLWATLSSHKGLPRCASPEHDRPEDKKAAAETMTSTTMKDGRLTKLDKDIREAICNEDMRRAWTLYNSKEGRRSRKVVKGGEESLDVLMSTLTRQRDDMRQAEQRTANPERKKKKQYLVETVTEVKSSTYPGSAKYSFGKKRHEKGNFKLQVLNPRDVEYRQDANCTPNPGVGTYKLSHHNGDDLPEVDGYSGGWLSRNHEIFMSTLAECEKEWAESRKFHARHSHLGAYESDWAGFFDRLVARLPSLSKQALTDHLRWLADQEENEARKHRRVNKWIVGSQTGEEPPVDRQEQREQKHRQQELHRQAELQEERWGLRRRDPVFSPHQYDQDGRMLEKNMRGHPEYRKAPGYTFGSSRELRDPTTKKHTGLSHVRSTSALDAPGPGQYEHIAGFAATCPAVLLRKSASAKLLSRPAAAKAVNDCPHAGPGYSGPVHAHQQRSMELRATQVEKPSYSIPRDGMAREQHLIRMPQMPVERHSLVTSFTSQY